MSYEPFTAQVGQTRHSEVIDHFNNAFNSIFAENATSNKHIAELKMQLNICNKEISNLKTIIGKNGISDKNSISDNKVVSDNIISGSVESVESNNSANQLNNSSNQSNTLDSSEQSVESSKSVKSPVLYKPATNQPKSGETYLIKKLFMDGQINGKSARLLLPDINWKNLDTIDGQIKFKEIYNKLPNKSEYIKAFKEETASKKSAVVEASAIATEE